MHWSMRFQKLSMQRWLMLRMSATEQWDNHAEGYDAAWGYGEQIAYATRYLAFAELVGAWG
jgi:hypothetical protein